MDWQQIVQKARIIKESFDKSYKSLNIDRPTTEETINKHIEILVNSLENIRVLLHVNYSRLTNTHKTAADAFYADVREKLIKVALRKGIKIETPHTLHEVAPFEPITHTESKLHITHPNMPQTVIEFLGTASRLIPDYDGRAENLQSFIDALCLVDTIKETHEAVAINLVKTKLKGAARNLISTETTLQAVVEKLKTSIKGETVDVVTARLMNVRQQNKNANTYATEVEDLAKRLEGAYISDGLPTELASTYATKTAVKAIIKNATNEKVKTVMESATFSNMNEVTAKFVSSCTETFGHQNSVLFYGNDRRRNGQYHKHHRRNGNYNNQRNPENYRNNNNRNNSHNDNNRGRGRNNYRGNSRSGYRNGGNHNVRVLNNNSENEQAPLNVQ